MNKIKLILLGFVLILNFNVKAQATKENTRACAHAVSSIVIAYNNMSASDFHDLQVILHMNLNDSDKLNLIENLTGFDSVYNAIVQNIAILNSNNYTLIFKDLELKDSLINITSNDFGYGDVAGAPNNDPCKGYKQGQSDCVLTLHLCMCSITALCATSTIAFMPCFLAGSTLCAGIATKCGDDNDKANPDCVPATIITWSQHITNYSQGSY